MNCTSCYENDGSEVPAIAPNENGIPACEACIRRDAAAVTWVCDTCENERQIPTDAWLDGDYRCDPCADREAAAYERDVDYARRNHA